MTGFSKSVTAGLDFSRRQSAGFVFRHRRSRSGVKGQSSDGIIPSLTGIKGKEARITRNQ